MDKKSKFEGFLDSLKDDKNSPLIESVKEGFQACFEMGYSSGHEWYETNLRVPFKGLDDLEVAIDYDHSPYEAQTQTDPTYDENVSITSVVLLNSKFNRSDGGDTILAPYLGKDIVKLLPPEELARIEEDMLTGEDITEHEEYAPEREDFEER